MKYYVVADVHGFYEILKSALSDAGFFDDPTPHKLLVLGDLFDRGKEAKELQDFILELMDKDEVILVPKRQVQAEPMALQAERSNGDRGGALNDTLLFYRVGELPICGAAHRWDTAVDPTTDEAGAH